MGKKSKLIGVRFREEELAALEHVCASIDGGSMNPSECIRFLIVREYAKRVNGKQSHITQSMVASDFRNGRPARDGHGQPPPLPKPGRGRHVAADAAAA